MANTRPVDPTKASNRKCEHCEFWGGWDARRCKLSQKEKEYYHRCKNFIWRKDGTYTQPPVDYAVPPKATAAERQKAAAVARKLASQMWGRPDHQHKLAEGIWSFSTPRHGGIIVDTDIRPDILDIRENTFVYQREGSPYGLSVEQHFVALEEDCDACIAEWLYTDEIITPKLYKRYITDKPFEGWKKERVEMIRRSLAQWNPEVLEMFPTENRGMRGDNSPAPIK